MLVDTLVPLCYVFVQLQKRKVLIVKKKKKAVAKELAGSCVKMLYSFSSPSPYPSPVNQILNLCIVYWLSSYSVKKKLEWFWFYKILILAICIWKAVFIIIAVETAIPWICT